MMDDPVSEKEVPTDSLAERAAAVLQRAVLTGELPPGSKLRIHDLMKAYGIGATPLREGLSRLVAAGFVEANSQRGFRVVPVSRADLEDIIRTRSLIETEALRLALLNGDDEWEAGIVAALYRLQKAGRNQEEGVPEGTASFDAIHKAFHTALIAACGSPRLLELHSMLFDQTYRYRQVIRRNPVPHRVKNDEHQMLADAALARDFEQAAKLLESHLRVTLALSETAEPKTAKRRGRRKTSDIKSA